MFDSIRQFWSETMEITEARWVVWLTLLLILVVTAIYVAKVFRDFAFGGRPGPADRIEDLKRLRDIGALNDIEYRRAREASQSGNSEVDIRGGSVKPDASGHKLPAESDSDGER